MLFTNNLYNIIFAFYVLVCLIFLVYYYSKEGFELQTKTINKDINKNENIFYLLWNGNYSSTYRLSQMLIDEGKIVQPLYINFTLEKCNNSLSNCKLKQNKYINIKY